MNVVSHTIVDVFNRNINISGIEKKVPIEKSISWNLEQSVSELNAQIELNNLLENTLISLGNKITFSDPYLFGDLKEEDGEVKTTSKSQLIFFNALTIALAKSDINYISIIGSWRNAKRVISTSKEKIFEKYKKLFKSIKNIVQKISEKELIVELFLTELPFHDRHWFGSNEGNEIVYHVSNSINGIFENSEVTFTPKYEVESYSERMKLQRRRERSEKISILNGTT